MTEFERITQSPETLAAFLASLPCIEGPWDVEFQKRFCSGCARTDCDSGEPCPHAAERSNPGWWLNLETDGNGYAEKYAVIVTYNNGTATGAVVEAESAAGAWGKLLSLFNPEQIRAVDISQILIPERGGAK